MELVFLLLFCSLNPPNRWGLLLFHRNNTNRQPKLALAKEKVEKVAFKVWQRPPLSAKIADGSLHLLSGRILVLLTGQVQRGHSGPACTCAPISPPVWCHMFVRQTTGSLFFLPAASVHWPHSVRPAKTKSFWAVWRWPFGRSSKTILLALKWWMRASARGVPLENVKKSEEYLVAISRLDMFISPFGIYSLILSFYWLFFMIN